MRPRVRLMGEHALTCYRRAKTGVANYAPGKDATGEDEAYTDSELVPELG